MFFKAYRQQRRMLRQGKDLLHGIRKQRVYHSDALEASDRAALSRLEEELSDALKEKSLDKIKALEREAAKLGRQLFPSSRWDWLSENVEVFVVAVVIALAIRTYFFQPFKIPTGSMEPTLNGVRLTSWEGPLPSWPVRALETVLLGRSYIDVKTEEGGLLYRMVPGQYFLWFEYTDLYIGRERLRVWSNKQAIEKYFRQTRDPLFHSEKLLSFQPGESVIYARSDTGDQVLANKMVYHFRKPKVGDVFVFTTQGIRRIQLSREGNLEGSQYYIKRCVGLPGDVLELQPPHLILNGEVVRHPTIFEKIYSMKEGYAGYVVEPSQRYLNPVGAPYRVPAESYWALGDNSRHSFDSRWWGPVPRKNLVGTGLVVYWPFTSHWGWIY